MEKRILESFIKSYNLGGKVNAVKWNVKGDQVQVIGTDEHREIVAVVGAKGLEGVDDGVYGIFDTTLMAALLSALENDISASVKTINLGDDEIIPLKIKFSDGDTQVDIALANPKVIPDPPEMNMESLPDWDADIKLSRNVITKFKKAAAVLTHSTFSIVNYGSQVDLVIGHGSNNADKFSIKLDAENISSNLDSVSFTNDAFVQVLNVISNLDEAVLHVSHEGLGFIESKSSDLVARYFLLAKEEITNE